MIFSIILLAGILIDQHSKIFFSNFLATNQYPILSDFLVLKLRHNTGIAFSLPLEGLLLKAVTIFLIVAILVYFLRYEAHRNRIAVRIGYALVLSGAISNAIERIAFGRVVDFIAVKYFAIFNFADIFISVGAGILFLFYTFYEHSGRNPQ